MTYRYRDSDDATGKHAGTGGASPGKKTLTQSIARKPVAATDANGVAANADEAVERAAGGSGAPLRADVRERFESSLGADLSSVRVHTGAESQDASSAVGARAYTVGNDIHFGAGQYQPDDPFGLHLLAHEVAHTQQQSGGPAHRQNKLEVSTPGDAAEVEADSAADAMVAGRPTAITTSGPTLARQPRDASYARGEAGNGGAMGAAEFAQACDVKKVQAYSKIASVAVDLFKASIGAKFAAKKDDKSSDEKESLLQVEKELLSAGKQMTELAKELDTIKGGTWAERLEAVSGGLGLAGDVLSTIETFASIADTGALEKLKENPNEETAKAWAEAVVSKFDGAARLVDALPIEIGFIKDYFKVVLGSPRAYVRVFLSIMKRRYAGIDAEADVSKGDRSYGPWKGPSSRLGAETDNPHHDLYQYMLANMEIDGKKIQNCSYELARDLFASKIVRDETLANNVKARWLTHLGG